MKTTRRPAAAPPLRFAASRCRLAAVLVLLLPGAATAAAFLKLDGIDGSSTGVSASFELTAPTAADPAPRPGLRISKPADKRSPLLLKACGDGAVINRITLTWKDGEAATFRVTLENATVRSFSLSLEAGAPQPHEEFSLIFQRVEWSYFGPDGAINTAGGLGTRLDLTTGQATEKTYVPFRASLDRAAGQPGMRLSFPVERGRTYRIFGSTSLDGQWQTLETVTGVDDGMLERHLADGSVRLFLRVEALD